MKVEKNSPLAQMLLKLAAEHDPKLREAIRNGEVEGVNIIAVGGAPDGEVKELLESLAKDEDDCKNCENRDGCEDAKTATPCDDTEDADGDISIVDEIRSIANDPDIPESIAAPGPRRFGICRTRGHFELCPAYGFSETDAPVHCPPCGNACRCQRYYLPRSDRHPRCHAPLLRICRNHRCLFR